MQTDSGKLFVGGISWDTDEERLKEYFSAFGEVVEAVIMKDRITGRGRGFGFIVFVDPNVADRVVREKHNIDGRMVEAKRAVPRNDQNIVGRTSGTINVSPSAGRTKKIFVGGLASTVTESEFKSYFDQFGTITDVVVMYDHNTLRPRGFGFITYDSEDAVDKVLIKTFHELNGKMVEVKRAVPKELSPGPSRSPLGGYNYGQSRVNSFLNGYTQGYSSSTIGSYGVRMDGRFSPVSSGQSVFTPFGSGYGMGVNFEIGLNPGYGGASNFANNLNYGRGLSPYYTGNSDRFSNIGFESGNGGNSSFFSSATQNLWGSGGLNNGSNSANSNAHLGSASGIIGGNAFANSGVNWSSSGISSQAGGNHIFSNSGSLNYGGVDSGYTLGAGGYGRNSSTVLPPTSSFSTSVGFDGSLADFYSANYSDPTWGPSNFERDGSGPIGYGLGNAASDVSSRSSPGFIGGQSVNRRQSSRGNTT